MKNQRKKLASLNFGPIWQYDALFQKINGGTIILEKKISHNRGQVAQVMEKWLCNMLKK